jgi:hypothetical protein
MKISCGFVRYINLFGFSLVLLVLRSACGGSREEPEKSGDITLAETEGRTYKPMPGYCLRVS